MDHRGESLNTFHCTLLFSWFAVHCTSMNNTNELISADNKGYASYLMEHSINKALPGQVRNLSNVTTELLVASL